MSHFNDVANEWDNENKVSMMKKLAYKTQEEIQLKGKVDILDFGCGTGLFGLEFLDHTKSLTGMDTSEGMLNVFDQKTKELENVSSVLLNLEESKYDDKKFDLIISSMTFHHLNNPKETLSKLKGLLNSNGKIIIVDLDKEDGSFHPNNQEMGVKHFGFSKETLQSWANGVDLNLQHKLINSIDKNDKSYHQFLAQYKYV